MSVYLKADNVAYFSVPKCASTTLKTFFYVRQNPIKVKLQGLLGRGVNEVHAHAGGRSRAFEEVLAIVPDNAWKFAVVREPIGRVLSCYSNRVIYGERLNEPNFLKANADGKLPLKPSLDEFIMNLEDYMERSGVVLQHCRPLTFFLGERPEYFDRVYGIKELKTLWNDLDARLKGPIPKFERLQTGGGKIEASSLTDRQSQKIKDLLESDYRIFGRYFDA